MGTTLGLLSLAKHQYCGVPLKFCSGNLAAQSELNFPLQAARGAGRPGTKGQPGSKGHQANQALLAT